MTQNLGTPSTLLDELAAANQQLHTVQERLRLALEAGDLGVWDWDIKADHVLWSDRIYEMHGLPKDGFGGTVEAVRNLVHPDDRERVSYAIAAALEGRAPYELQLRIVRPTGEIRHLSTTAQVLFDDDGEPFRMVGLSRDITERLLAEQQLRAADEQLRATEQRLALARSAAGLATWEWEFDSGRVIWSPEVYIITGLDPSVEPAVDTWHNTIHPEDRDRAVSEARRAWETSKSLTSEFRVVRPDGSVRWILARSIILSDEVRSKRMVGINMDITERKNAETSLMRTEKLAAAGRLAATVAHEINNPLEAVTNLIFLASKSPELKKDTRSYLQTALTEVSRIASITRQTLGFYRDSTRPECVDIASVVEEVLAVYGRKLDQKKIKVVRRLAPAEPVFASNGEIRQILANLISNSIDALQEDGILAVGLRQRSNEVVATIADNGCGMSRSDRARIFEPFFTTKDQVGTGLGMWITSTLVAKYHGTIRVRSSAREGRHGTVVTVSLPMNSTAENTATAASNNS